MRDVYKLSHSKTIQVEIEAHCGSVNCLFTPKQLHALILLFNAYQKAGKRTAIPLCGSNEPYDLLLASVTLHEQCTSVQYCRSEQPSDE